MSTARNDIAPYTRGPGRPRIRMCPDLRLTVRFRYHCDQDLILVLQKTLNKNDLIRNALRHWLLEQGDAQL